MKMSKFGCKEFVGNIDYRKYAKKYTSLLTKLNQKQQQESSNSA